MHTHSYYGPVIGELNFIQTVAETQLTVAMSECCHPK